MATRRQPKPKRAANSANKRRGRPTDYRPELCAVARKLALLGLTDEEMAEVIGKPIGTFNRWKAEHEEFREALKEGKRPANADVAAGLFERAKGFEWEEQQAIKLKEIRYGENGKKVAEIERVEVVTVKRKAPPDTMACMYWLNNRERDSGNWRRRHEHPTGPEGDGVDAVGADRMARDQTRRAAGQRISLLVWRGHMVRQFKRRGALSE